MPPPESSFSLLTFESALRDYQRAYLTAGAQARLDIERRLQRLSHRAADTLDTVKHAAMKVETVRCAMAVRQAIEGSEQRFLQLLKSEFEGLDFSQVWGALWGVAKEAALYIGGGAAIGGTVGGVAGAFAGGVGAVPGAIGGAGLGAKIGAEVLVWMGLASLVGYIGKAVPEMCGKFSEGFALAWRAGELPNNAGGQYASLMLQATDAFAQGKMLLVKAILCAIVLYLSRGQASSSMLMKEISKSKLGPGFADWVAANQAKLLKHKALQPKIAAAEGEAGAAAKGAQQKPPANEPVKNNPADDAAQKKGEAKQPCPACLLVAQPVNPISGAKILADERERDFALPAVLPFAWQRTYSSALRLAGWLGQGWSTPISDTLRVSATEVVILDAYQRDITFSLPRVGESIYSPSEKITLVRTGERQFEIVDEGGQRTLFAMPATANDIAYMVGIIDPNDNKISIQYNARQLPERVLDSAGREYVLTFADHRGHARLQSIGLLRTADQVDPLVEYAYDAGGNLAQVRNRVGEVTREFTYRNHVMVEHSQPGGLVSRYEYDEYAASGKVLRNWTNNGLSWNFEYRRQETVVTDNLGRQQRFQFDAKNRFVGEVDPAGGVTTRRVDADGNLVAVTDPGGRTIGYRYDQRGRVIRVESGGNGTGIVYDSRFDKPALITNALGATTTLRYDERGNLASVTDALGHRTSYQYDEHGLPVKVTDAAGGVKRLAYNRAGQLISYTDCSGNTTHYSYDDEGRLVLTTDANGAATAYAYDPVGRLLALTLPDGATEGYEYDSLGRLTAHIDAGGHRTSYVLDLDGKPVKRIDARGGVLEYRYDEARRMAELVNENGDVHKFVYDALDRLAEETGFDARFTRFRYDGSGLMIAKEEYGSGARSETARIDTSYTRNSVGQLTEKIISRITGEAQAEQMRLRYTYDALGRMTRAINADADVALEYDALGQLLAEQTSSGGMDSVLLHAYDELGNRIQTVLPDGRVVNNLFYGSGHLHQINLDGEVISDITRDRTHRPISRSQGALTTQLQYDAAGRIASSTATLSSGEGAAPVIARSYRYDQSGNLLSIDDTRNGVVRFHYDVTGRILSAVQPQLEEHFAFDPAHNLINPLAQGGRVENNRICVFEDKRFDYDTHGNLTEKRVGRHTQLQFQWNAAHQLIRSTRITGNASSPGTAQMVTYTYDPFGRRIAKKDAFGTTRFVWDGDRLQCELRGSRGRTYFYEPGSFVPLAQLDDLSSTSDSGVKSRSQLSYLHTDQAGTPREMTDPDGQVTWAASYRAWGNVLRIETPAPSHLDAPVADESVHHDELVQLQAIRFQGQYHDCETGLHYNRFRYYDPDVGRYISQDPIGLAGGTNSYMYGANPTGWVDPLGLAAGVPNCVCPPHISQQKQAGHVAGTPQYANRVKVNKPTSAYANWEDAIKYTDEAWQKGTPVPDRPGVKDYEFGHPVGTSPTGGTQSKVRVHQDSKGKIHSHPAGPVTLP